ncbi:MAG: Asp-tRNA(Asn)/Glu-tRNA(Gln) amidotransferase subunit GatB [Patescibacteria group bacterium]|nr:Asp-tRNA(Asn)/Glu-tRNA(Gln) amidotransferase subunit GatB [Patescibacteria group bacterium]
MKKYTPVIGLEIHAQLKTKSKMFCSCPNNAEAGSPNTYICPVCLGHPGTFPVINKEAVINVLRAGKALNCSLRDESHFDRKNYFYPDLPKGYQISQDKKPFCYNGYLEVGDRKIRINRIHLEEDTGRIVHNEKEKESLIDFNRSGVPLMELVTEPDIRSAEEACGFAKELQLILRYLGVSEANMDQGQMRVEVNISLCKENGDFGTKVEIKNLNSFRTVYNATKYEIRRQREVLERGESVIQETRGWHDQKEKTFSQRAKEDAHDYRYFPEPDLPPLFLNKSPFKKDDIEVGVELPKEKRNRFKNDYGVDKKNEIEVFIANREVADYFEETVELVLKKINKSEAKKEVGKIAKNYLFSEILGMLNGELVNETKIDSLKFANFVILVYNKEISSKIAKTVIKEMFESGKEASVVIQEKGLSEISDKGEIKKVVDEVIIENQSAVKEYKEGKIEVLQFLIGKVMVKTKGKASPDQANKILKEKLQGRTLGT